MTHTATNVEWRQRTGEEATFEIRMSIILDPSQGRGDIDVSVGDKQVVIVKARGTVIWQCRMYSAIEKKIEWTFKKNESVLAMKVTKSQAETWPALLNVPLRADDQHLLSRSELDSRIARDLTALPQVDAPSDVSVAAIEKKVVAIKEKKKKGSAADDGVVKAMHREQAVADLRGIEIETKAVTDKLEKMMKSLNEAAEGSEEKETLTQHVKIASRMLELVRETCNLRSEITIIKNFLIGPYETEEFQDHAEKQRTGIQLFSAALQNLNQDPGTAIHLFRLAAIHRHHDPSVLALFSINTNVPSSYPRGASLVRGEGQEVEATNSRVGDLFNSGTRHFPPISSFAVHFHQRAAIAGNTHSMVSLAMLFLRSGDDTMTPAHKKLDSDVKRANYLIQCAVDRGSIVSYLVRAAQYIDGADGMPKSMDMAREYYERAIAADSLLTSIVSKKMRIGTRMTLGDLGKRLNAEADGSFEGGPNVVPPQQQHAGSGQLVSVGSSADYSVANTTSQHPTVKKSILLSTWKDQQILSAGNPFPTTITVDCIKVIEDVCCNIGDDEKLVVIQKLCNVKEVRETGYKVVCNYVRVYQLSKTSSIFPKIGLELLEALMLLDPVPWAQVATRYQVNLLVSGPFPELKFDANEKWNVFYCDKLATGEISPRSLDQLLSLVSAPTPQEKIDVLLRTKVIRERSPFRKELILLQRLVQNTATFSEIESVNWATVQHLFPGKGDLWKNDLAQRKQVLAHWDVKVRDTIHQLQRLRIHVPSTLTIAHRDMSPWATISPEEIYGPTICSYFDAPLKREGHWFTETEEKLLQHGSPEWTTTPTFDALKRLVADKIAKTISPNSPIRDTLDFLNKNPMANMELASNLKEVMRLFKYKEHLSEEMQRIIAAAEKPTCTNKEATDVLKAVVPKGTNVFGLVAERLLLGSQTLLSFIRSGLTTPGFEHFPSICRNDPELCVVASLEVPEVMKALRGLENQPNLSTASLSALQLTEESLKSLISMLPHAELLNVKAKLEFTKDLALVSDVMKRGVVKFKMNELAVIGTQRTEIVSDSYVKRLIKVASDDQPIDDWESFVIREEFEGAQLLKRLVTTVVALGKVIVQVTQQHLHELLNANPDLSELKIERLWWNGGLIEWEKKICQTAQSDIDRIVGFTKLLRNASEQMLLSLRKAELDCPPLRLLPRSLVIRIAGVCCGCISNITIFHYVAQITGIPFDEIRRMHSDCQFNKSQDAFERCGIFVKKVFLSLAQLTSSVTHPPQIIEVSSLAPENWWNIVAKMHADRTVHYYELALPHGDFQKDLEQIDCIIERAQMLYAPRQPTKEAPKVTSLHFVIVLGNFVEGNVRAIADRIGVLPVDRFYHQLTFVCCHESPARGYLSHLLKGDISTTRRSKAKPLHADDNLFVCGPPRSGKSFGIQQKLKLPSLMYNVCCLHNHVHHAKVSEVLKESVDYGNSLQKNGNVSETNYYHISIATDSSISPHIASALLTLLLFRFSFDNEFVTTYLKDFTVSWEFGCHLPDQLQQALRLFGNLKEDKPSVPELNGPAHRRKYQAIRAYYDKLSPMNASVNDKSLLDFAAHELSKTDTNVSLSEGARTATDRTWLLPLIVVPDKDLKLTVVTFIPDNEIPHGVKLKDITIPRIDLSALLASNPEKLLIAMRQLISDLPPQVAVTLPGAELMLRLKTEWLSGCDLSIVVGATGCGKTFHIDCLARSLQYKNYTLHVTAATQLKTTDKRVLTIEKHLDEMLTALEANNSLTALCFFDEINTSGLLSVIKCVVFDKVFPYSTKNIAERLQRFRNRILFAAAANPYIRCEDHLVYAVQAHVPESVQECAVSMLELKPEYVEEVASSMAKKVLSGIGNFNYDRLGEMIRSGWCGLADKELPVSLRTVDAFLNGIVNLRPIIQALGVASEDDEANLNTFAIAVSWGIFFAFPTGKELPTELSLCWKGVIERLEKYVFSLEAKKLSDVDVVESADLKELVGVVLICGIAQIPLILFGPPGTSKSFAVSLVIRTCASAEFQSEFPQLPTLSPHYFQCSDNTSASALRDRLDSVGSVNKNSSRGGRIIACACVDELSLAPMHVVRAINEKIDGGNISLLATSNFAVDRALFNRCVVVHRKPIQENHKKLSELTTEKMGKAIGKYADAICSTLLREVKPDTLMFQNHALSVAIRHIGCRDWYAFVKNKVDRLSDEDIDKLILRDFGFGVRYLGTAESYCNPMIRSFPATAVDTPDWVWSKLEAEAISAKFHRPSSRRPMMVVADSFSLFMEHLRKAIPDLSNTQFIFGDILSPSPSASSEQLLKLKEAMMLGKLTVMFGTEHLSEALLDVLNASYTVLGERLVARVSIDGTWAFWIVHDTFKLIFVQLPREHYLSPKLLSSAFFDRFERRQLMHQVRDNTESDVQARMMSLSALVPRVGQDPEWLEGLLQLIAAYPEEFLYGYHASYLPSLEAITIINSDNKEKLNVLGLIKATKVLSVLGSQYPNYDVLSIAKHLQGVRSEVKQCQRLCLVSVLPPNLTDIISFVRDRLGISAPCSAMMVTHMDTDDVLQQLVTTQTNPKSATVVVYDAARGVHTTKLSYNLFAILETLKGVKGRVIVIANVARLTDISHVELEFHPMYQFIVAEDAFIDTKKTIGHSLPEEMKAPWWVSYLTKSNWIEIFSSPEEPFVGNFFESIRCLPHVQYETSAFVNNLLVQHADMVTELSLYIALGEEFRIKYLMRLATEILHPSNIVLLEKPTRKDLGYADVGLQLLAAQCTKGRGSQLGRQPGLLPAVLDCPFYSGTNLPPAWSECASTAARYVVGNTAVCGPDRAVSKLSLPLGPAVVEFRISNHLNDTKRLASIETAETQPSSTVNPISGAFCRHTSDSSHPVKGVSQDEFPFSFRVRWCVLYAMSRVRDDYHIPKGPLDPTKKFDPVGNQTEILKRMVKSIVDAAAQVSDNAPIEVKVLQRRSDHWESFLKTPGSIEFTLSARIAIPAITKALRAILIFFDIKMPISATAVRSKLSMDFANRWSLQAIPSAYRTIIDSALRFVPEFQRNSNVADTHPSLLQTYNMLLAHLTQLCQRHNAIIASLHKAIEKYKNASKECPLDKAIAASEVSDFTPILDLAILKYIDPIDVKDDIEHTKKTEIQKARAVNSLALVIWAAAAAGAKPIDTACFELGEESHDKKNKVADSPTKSEKDLAGPRIFLRGSLHHELSDIFPKNRSTLKYPSTIYNGNSHSSEASHHSCPKWLNVALPAAIADIGENLAEFLEDILWTFLRLQAILPTISEAESDKPLAKLLTSRLPVTVFRSVPWFLNACHLTAVMRLAVQMRAPSTSSSFDMTVSDFVQFMLATRGCTTTGYREGYSCICDWIDTPLSFLNVYPTARSTDHKNFVSREALEWSRRLIGMEDDEDYIQKVAKVARERPNTLLSRLAIETENMRTEQAEQQCFRCFATKDILAPICACRDTRYCRACATQAIHECVQTQTIPQTVCEKKCDIHEVARNLPAAVKAGLVHKDYLEELSKFLERQKRLTMFQCPNTSHAPVYVDIPTDAVTIYCKECQCHRCADKSCGKLYHPKSNCATVSQLESQGLLAFQKIVDMVNAKIASDEAEAKRLQDAEIKRLESAQAAFLASEQELKQGRYCPHCNRLIIHISGCSSMVCGRDYHGTQLMGGCGKSFTWGDATQYQPSGDGGYGDRLAMLKRLSGPQPRKFTSRQCVYCNKHTEVGLEATCVNCPEDEYYCLPCILSYKTCKRDDRKSHLFSLVNGTGAVVGAEVVSYVTEAVEIGGICIHTMCPGCKAPGILTKEAGCLDVTCSVCSTRYFACCKRLYHGPQGQGHRQDPKCEEIQRKFYGQ